MAHLDFTFDLRHQTVLIAQFDARVSCDERYRLTYEVADLATSFPLTYVTAPVALTAAMRAQLSLENKDWQRELQDRADEEAYGYQRDHALENRETAA